MKLQFNFHRKTGLKPGFGASVEKYGVGVVIIFRVYWSAFTITLWENTIKSTNSA